MGWLETLLYNTHGRKYILHIVVTRTVPLFGLLPTLNELAACTAFPDISRIHDTYYRARLHQALLLGTSVI